MFAPRLYALFCTLSLLVAPGSCIIRCPSLDDLSRSQDVPLIDGKFEDCVFEGPLMGNYGGRSSISENNPETKLYYNFHSFDKYIKANSSLVNSKLVYSLKGNISYEYYANYESLDFVLQLCRMHQISGSSISTFT